MPRGPGDRVSAYSRTDPVRRLDLETIVSLTASGAITHDQAQREVSYAVWIERSYHGFDGDSAGDWDEAARVLNRAAEAADVGVSPW